MDAVDALLERLRVAFADARPGAELTSECAFESQKVEFPQFGIRLHVLEPGEPNGLYHSENQQEAFLVLSGACRLLVEGEERLLRPWDFFHSPAVHPLTRACCSRPASPGTAEPRIRPTQASGL